MDMEMTLMETKLLTESDRIYIMSSQEDHFGDIKSKLIMPAKIQESFVAFANADGGEIYVGVNEIEKGKSREIDGFLSIEEANGLIDTLVEQTNPSVENVDIEYLSYENKYVLHIIIPKSPKVHLTAKDKCYIRVNANNREIKGERITQLSYAKGIFSFEKQISENTEIEDILNGTYLSEYLNRINTSLQPSDFLHKQKLIIKKNGNEYVTIAAVLLFSDEPQGELSTRCGLKLYRMHTTEKNMTGNILRKHH
jgi:ATP-dependent DNA helicase RecG